MLLLNKLSIAIVYVLVASQTLFHGSNALGRTWQDGIGARVPAVLDEPCPPRGVCRALEGAMPYRYYLPEGYSADNEYPLVLFLHGAGERGTGNDIHVARYIQKLIDETETNHPAILLAPQVMPGDSWAPGSPNDRTDEILSQFLSTYSVDTNRLYVTGISMGGFGTMSYLHYYNVDNPDILRFAAGAPVAGSFISEYAVDDLRHTPIWLGHGDVDDVVSVESARETFNALVGAPRDAPIAPTEFALGGPTAVGGVTRYTEYPDVRHDSWVPYYASDDLYDWMFSQSLAVPEPATSVSAMLGLVCLGLGVRRRHSERQGT